MDGPEVERWLNAGAPGPGELTGLQLPSKDYDLPLALFDREFDVDGELVYDPFMHFGAFGDKICVNGAIQPYHGVKRRKYRLRILNASNSRFFMLFLTDSKGGTYTFDQIGQDGSLLSAPRYGIDRIFLGDCLANGEPITRLPAIGGMALNAG